MKKTTPNSIYEVSKTTRQACYYRQRGLKGFRRLQPGLDWSYDIFMPYRDSYDRWPQAWAKALFLLVNEANALILKDPAEFSKYVPGVRVVIKYLQRRCRETRVEWEKKNPELIEETK